jgi:hypothetical protein
VPALADLVMALRRGRALRGARRLGVEGASAEPLEARREDGSRALLRVETSPADARLGERGEPVWARLRAAPEDAGPYRGQEVLRAPAIESAGERRERWKLLGASAACVLLSGLLVAGAASSTRRALLDADARRAAVRPAHVEPPLGPRPPAPGPRGLPPLPPSWGMGRHANRTAIQMRTERRCEAGERCYSVRVYADPVTGREFECGIRREEDCLLQAAAAAAESRDAAHAPASPAGAR